MAKFIADTSAWIDAFCGTLKDSSKTFFETAVQERDVVLTTVIRVELLVGTPDRKQFDWLKKHLEPFECLSLRAEDNVKLEEFAWELGMKGLRGKFTDVSIAYLAHSSGLPILSLDGYFHKLAKKGIVEMIEG